MQRGTERGGQYGVCSSDLRGTHSEEQLLLSVGEVEGMSPMGWFLAEELEYGRLEEEQGRV